MDGLSSASSAGASSSLSEMASMSHGHGHSHSPSLHPLALGIALGSILCKELLYRYTLRIGKKINSGVLIANAYHHRSDAASSAVALVGIAGSLVGLPLLDPIGGLLVSGMILKAGIDTSVR